MTDTAKKVLAINIGNTNVHFSSGEIIETKDLDSIHSLDTTSYSHSAIIASVVPETLVKITSELTKRGFTDIYHIDKNNTDILDAKIYAETLGDDRFIECYEAVAKTKDAQPNSKHAPIIIYDFGTATTVNIINSSACLISGLIFLGIQSSLTALNTLTAKLPLLNLKELDMDIPSSSLSCNTTETNLLYGAVVGHAEMINGIHQNIVSDLKEYGEKESPIIYITGGNAKYIRKYLNFNFTFDQNLIMDGLQRYYKLTYA